jgi:hypothetical protein
MADYSLTRFGHIGNFDGDPGWPLDGRGLLAQIVELKPAERAPVQITAQKFLEIAERILVHRVDMIDSTELFHAITSATGAAAFSAEEEQKPLVPGFAGAAFLALQNGMVDKLLAERTADPHQVTTAS